jgi:hypothetical protein
MSNVCVVCSLMPGWMQTPTGDVTDTYSCTCHQSILVRVVAFVDRFLLVCNESLLLLA